MLKEQYHMSASNPKKAAKDTIDFAMKKTWHARYSWIWGTCRPSWGEVLERYPHLNMSDHVKEDYIRLRYVWKNLSEYLASGKATRLVDMCKEKKMEYKGEKRPAKEAKKDIDLMRESAASRGEDGEVWAAIACIPYLAKEDPLFWICEKPLGNGQPCVVVRNPGTGSANVTFEPYLDAQRLCPEESLGLEKCFEVLIQAIHLVGAQFTMKTRKSWWLVCETMLGVREKGSTSHLSSPFRVLHGLVETA
ncbi:uncharacterized protein LOC127751343 [Frankliniella occidentalis]|uniref:Uncharacterized protein LOC127751343 n=1 Tax=Frankliniella occidentalis TaxID=133901 RepID=A0A9C6X7Z8_FRAOC|nr:uncharacterized protein LOC127751343 [Frankliniella occidentalis]